VGVSSQEQTFKSMVAGAVADHAVTWRVDDIAGVCDQSGLVFGLMPHPERHVVATQHPSWTGTRTGSDEGAGLKVFRNAVAYVSEAVATGV
jgi:hypothetical protein